MAARHGGAHCSAFRHWKCPQLGQGREHIMFSPLPKLWALPMSESGAMGAAVFFQCDSRPLFDTFCLENLSVFSIHQKMEQNPTYNWADLIHFRDENQTKSRHLFNRRPVCTNQSVGAKSKSWQADRVAGRDGERTPARRDEQGRRGTRPQRRAGGAAAAAGL